MQIVTGDTPPNSGTASRSRVAEVPATLVGAALGAAAGRSQGGLVGALQGGGGGALAGQAIGSAIGPAITGRVVMNPLVQSWLGDRWPGAVDVMQSRMGSNQNVARGFAAAEEATAQQTRDQTPITPPEFKGNKTFELLISQGVPRDVAVEAMRDPAKLQAILRDLAGEQDRRRDARVPRAQ
jgi:hypothetical protein